MSGKRVFIVVAIAVATTVGGVALAGGGMGGGMGGNGAGSMGGSDMMGGGGNGTMGSGQAFSGPWTSQPHRSPVYQNKQHQTQRLREEIRARRYELSELYRSDKPDKVLIGQKIAELKLLEAELDGRTSSN